MKKKTSTELWLKATEPIVKFCAANRGAQKAILDTMSKMHPPAKGKAWNRQHIGKFLAVDAA